MELNTDQLKKCLLTIILLIITILFFLLKINFPSIHFYTNDIYSYHPTLTMLLQIKLMTVGFGQPNKQPDHHHHLKIMKQLHQNLIPAVT